MKSKKLLAMLIVLALAVCIFPVSAFADGTSSDDVEEVVPSYSVTPISASAYSRSSVNLRYYPSTSAPAYSPLLTYKTPLTVTGYAYDEYNAVWYQVVPQSGSLAGKTGFVRNDCLDFVGSGASIEPEVW